MNFFSTGGDFVNETKDQSNKEVKVYKDDEIKIVEKIKILTS